MKKSMLGVMLAISLVGQSSDVVQASSVESVTEQSIAYRVMVDDEVIGMLSDISVYDRFLETKMRTLLAENPGQVVQEPSNVTVIEELTLLPLTTANDEQVLNVVERRANFKTSSNVVTVNSEEKETSFMVSDINIVTETVHELMRFYLGEEAFANIVQDEEKIKLLSDEGSQFIGAKVLEEIKIEGNIANASEVLSEDEARRMMLYQNPIPQLIANADNKMTIADVESKYDLTFEELKLLNPHVSEMDKDDVVKQTLDVTPINPLFTIETEKEEVIIEEVSFETEYIEDDTILEGKTEVDQEGEDGEFLTRTAMVSLNGEIQKVEVLEKTTLKEPVKEVIRRGTKVEAKGVATGVWVWPTTSYSITNGYLGYAGHYAIDIDAYTGQPVYAADGGQVVSAGWDGAYGYSILINHKNGYYSRYSHLSSLNVSSGSKIMGGEIIGAAGSTGNSTGTHLHFEIRTNTGSQPSYAPNPLDFY